MAAKLFGFSIEDGENKPKGVVSPVPQNNEDGVDHYLTSGFFGSYVDIEGVYRSEYDLVKRYREMALHPEVDGAIEDIVNEGIVANVAFITKFTFIQFFLLFTANCLFSFMNNCCVILYATLTGVTFTANVALERFKFLLIPTFTIFCLSSLNFLGLFIDAGFHIWPMLNHFCFNKTVGVKFTFIQFIMFWLLFDPRYVCEFIFHRKSDRVQRTIGDSLKKLHSLKNVASTLITFNFCVFCAAVIKT